jgi:GNAT superfamily N-acetyltransferase
VKIEIREARESDLLAILSLHRELENPETVVTLSLEQARKIFERIGGYPNYKIFLAQIEEQIVGTFALLLMDNLAHNGSPSGVVEDVVVASNWQGNGIGKAMMTFARERCHNYGCYKLVLSSNSKRTKAHQFYESLGFVKHGFSFSTEQLAPLTEVRTHDIFDPAT